jgi:hypothetical protein
MQPWPRGVLLLSYPYSRLHAASRHLCPCRVSIYYVPSPWRPHGQDQPSSGATRASAINKALPWSGERAMAAPAGWAAEIVRSVCVCVARICDARAPVLGPERGRSDRSRTCGGWGARQRRVWESMAGAHGERVPSMCVPTGRAAKRNVSRHVAGPGHAT